MNSVTLCDFSVILCEINSYTECHKVKKENHRVLNRQNKKKTIKQ
jgi:hypothetical protein